MRLVSKLLAIVVFGIVAGLAGSPLAAAFVASGHSSYIIFAILTLISVLCLTAPTGRRAWGRGSLIAGALFVALPLSTIALSARVGSDVVTNAATSDAGAAAVGATIGAGLLVGASAFVGFILGAIFLIAGLVLVLGGRREVIVVERR